MMNRAEKEKTKQEVIELCRGAWDLHVHAWPDTQLRKSNVLEMVKEGREAGFAGALYKCHWTNTGPVAQVLNLLHPDFDLIGCIVLNQSVGGINPRAVEVALAMGAKVVYFPTLDAHHQLQMSGRNEDGLTVFDRDRNLTLEAKKIVEMTVEAKAVICTGHLSLLEAAQVIHYAASLGSHRILATHVSSSLIAMPIEMQRSLSKQAFLEHCLADTTSAVGKAISLSMIMDQIRSVGPEHCVLTTDFGQLQNPKYVDGMYSFVESLLEAGFTRSEIRMMIIENPGRLVR